MSLNKNQFLAVKQLLDEKVDQFNRKSFIVDDPVSVPHQFTKKQDIEIAGLFAAVLAWGQRKTIIAKSKELLSYMDESPHEFVVHHRPTDLKRFSNFKHRTFNATDLLYFIYFLNHYYKAHTSLEDAFFVSVSDENVGNGLIQFHNLFCGLPPFPDRTRKHIATPLRNSACKRLCMYLRWMVREDDRGVDFGIWKRIKPSQLVCPCDVHVERVARRLKLITRKALDWETALELTAGLKRMDATDPVKYDFALFGLGVAEKF